MIEQTRRVWLKFTCRTLTLGYAALMLIPGVRFLVDPLMRRSTQNSEARRVARLDDLQPNVPRPFAIKGSRLDAWTLYPEETLGRVFLVRRDGDTVEAFTAECPHLGCVIEFQEDQDRFFCPCHRGVFDAEGAVVPSDQLGWNNPLPRGMDHLECEVVEDDDSGEKWVTVVFERFQHGLAQQVATA
ncbi:MAG: Rieske (2Fe-2S) protein [Pirellulales bacterium]|nr:Rieske (2Fe-2S) protein [Planctomycetales bacterium]